MKVKNIKRALLKPFYWLTLLWCLLFRKQSPYNFNSWLQKKGYWRLTNTLDNFKVIVPKEYIEFIKKHPTVPYIHLRDATSNSHTQS